MEKIYKIYVAILLIVLIGGTVYSIVYKELERSYKAQRGKQMFYKDYYDKNK